MKKLVRVLKDLDLLAWDNYTPLLVVGIFLLLGILFLLHVIHFRLEAGEVEAFREVYVAVGIEATSVTFAIIISLSLVAIQFASQEYSHRIMAYYMKGVMFWSTMIVYLSIMILAIILLINAGPTDSVLLPSMVAVGTILALTLLVPHFLITASYLRPEFIIGKLLRRVDGEYLKSVASVMAQENGRINVHADRLLPVVEIVERSLDRGDLATARESIELIYDTYVTRAEGLNNMAIERYFLEHLSRIGRRAVAEADEEAAILSIQLIGRVGSKGPAATIAVEDIATLGGTALKHDGDSVAQQMIDSLRQIYEGTQSQSAQDRVLGSYSDLVENLAAGEKGQLLRHLATNLYAIAEPSLQANRDTGAVTRCLDTLEAIGHTAAARKMFDVVLHVTQRMQGLGVGAATAEHLDVAESTIRSLLRVEQRLPIGERDLIAASEFAKGDIEREIRRMRRVAAAKRADAPEVPAPVAGSQEGRAMSTPPMPDAQPAALAPSSEATPAVLAREAPQPPSSAPTVAPAAKEPSSGDFSDVWEAPS